jgi:uncharacterized Zn-binding protein involved in type VI secretion
MTGIVRKNVDNHNGHSGHPGPYHKTFYNTGSPNVFVNNESAVRVGDSLTCGDQAKDGSSNVFINNKPVHRQNDQTTGHGTWDPSFALTGSPNVFAN